jgi:hypothetical protein
MSREHARPQPRPATAGTEEGQRSQPRCRSGSPATEPSGPGGKLDPPDHTQPNTAPHWAQGVPGGVKFRLLAPLIAQLVATLRPSRTPAPLRLRP